MEDRASRLAAYMDEILEGLPTPDASGPSGTWPPMTTWRRLSSIVGASGQRKNSPSLREEMAAAAEAAGLHTDVPLDDPTLSPATTVRFATVAFERRGVEPPSERELQNWILHYVGARGTPFSNCYAPRSEFTIPGTRWRVDMLMKERTNGGRFGGYVLVEFKVRDRDGTVAQLLRYLDAFKKTSLADGRMVRGAIISTTPQAGELRHLEGYREHDIRWYRFNADLKAVGGPVADPA